MGETISPAMSFKGFNLMTLLYRNKEAIKLLIAFLIGYNYFAGFSLSSFLFGIGGLLGKMAIDTIDFYFTDVKLK